jgi:hypothetical protein
VEEVMKLQARLFTGTSFLTPVEIDDTKVDGRDNPTSGRIIDQPLAKITEWSFNPVLRLLYGGKLYKIDLHMDGTFAATVD